jgi:hypothetical protein
MSKIVVLDHGKGITRYGMSELLHQEKYRGDGKTAHLNFVSLSGRESDSQ